MSTTDLKKILKTTKQHSNRRKENSCVEKKRNKILNEEHSAKIKIYDLYIRLCNKHRYWLCKDIHTYVMMGKLLTVSHRMHILCGICFAMGNKSQQESTQEVVAHFSLY